MARTPMLTRDRVPEPLRAAFDAETASSGGVVATGPGSVMIHSPEMRRRANHLVNYLRDESTLPKKIPPVNFPVIGVAKTVSSRITFSEKSRSILREEREWPRLKSRSRMILERS